MFLRDWMENIFCLIKNDFILLSSCKQQRFSKKIQDLLEFYHFEYYYFPDPVTFSAKDRNWLINHLLKDIFEPPDFSTITEQITL